VSNVLSQCSRPARLAFLACAMLAAGWWLIAPARAAELGSRAVSKKVDALLAKEVFTADADGTVEPAPPASDETFIRRVTLDLIGVPPSPEEITAYSLDPSPGKRAAAVERLLADKRFGQNWARYWRDVIMYRRSEDRALIAHNSVVSYLSDAFNDNRHWDQIARDFITATGDVSVDGTTAMIMAQMGVPEDTTAEMSRIFLGIQIQCAQCHDHPTDRWKREQFHELAAFFPRIAVRPVRVDGKQRTYEVVSINKGAKNPKRPGRGSLEHHMPDLDHPEEIGKLMQPVFFVTGKKLDSGLPDAERRETVADWMTDRDNRWFAKAFVNRMWSELVGRGFYEPVDDIGPDRQCSAPKTLDYLADRFAANQYDVKWLFTTITATDAYARQSRTRMDDDSAPFEAACPQRLRGDQLFNALSEVLGIQEGKQNGRNYRAALAGPRGEVNSTFGYDPSDPRDDVAGSIPQALYLMNSAVLGKAISAENAQSTLGQLLGKVPDDKLLVSELYLRCLAREPKPTELDTCLEHVTGSPDRAEAFEDILWALLNSTEFLNRK